MKEDEQEAYEVARTNCEEEDERDENMEGEVTSREINRVKPPPNAHRAEWHQAYSI